MLSSGISLHKQTLQLKYFHFPQRKISLHKSSAIFTKALETILKGSYSWKVLKTKWKLKNSNLQNRLYRKNLYLHLFSALFLFLRLGSELFWLAIFNLNQWYIQVISYWGIPGKEKTHKDHVIFLNQSLLHVPYTLGTQQIQSAIGVIYNLSIVSWEASFI